MRTQKKKTSFSPTGEKKTKNKFQRSIEKKRRMSRVDKINEIKNQLCEIAALPEKGRLDVKSENKIKVETAYWFQGMQRMFRGESRVDSVIAINKLLDDIRELHLENKSQTFPDLVMCKDLIDHLKKAVDGMNNLIYADQLSNLIMSGDNLFKDMSGWLEIQEKQNELLQVIMK